MSLPPCTRSARRIGLGLGLTLVALSASPAGVGCGGSGNAAAPQVPSGISAVSFGRVLADARLSDDGAALAEDFRAGALALVKASLARAASDHFALSPQAVQSVAGMLSLAAPAATQAELAGALGWHLAPSALAAAHDNLTAVVASRAESAGTNILQTASRVFVGDGRQLLPGLQSALASGFGATPVPIDFAGNPEGGRARINLWALEQTGGRIQTLLPEGSVAADTQVVAASALRFKAPWARPMARDASPRFTFTGRDGVALPVAGLRLEATLEVAVAPQHTVVRLPYEGQMASLVLVKPAGSIDDYRQGLDPNALDALALGAGTRRAPVSLAMPPFSVETELELRATLAALGLGASAPATFQFFEDGGSITLSGLFAQARIDVDEEGTEAVAAAAAVGVETSAPLDPPDPIVVDLDRPFLFLLVDDATGLVLFMGQVGSVS